MTALKSLAGWLGIATLVALMLVLGGCTPPVGIHGEWPQAFAGVGAIFGIGFVLWAINR